MSKGVKKVLGVVAAVFVPFVAPIIATAIAGSTLVGGFVSAVGGSITAALGGGAVGAAVAGGIGSGLVGAALGAGTAALTGGNVGQGALSGGLGGAFVGGSQAFGAAKAAGAAAGTPAAAPGATASAGSNAARVAIPGVTPASTAFSAPAALGPSATAAATTTGSSVLRSIGASLGNVAPQILQQAATYLVSGQLSATSSDERRLIAQAAARMREIEGQDNALYQQLLQEAQSIDPNAEGQQFYNQAKLEGVAAAEAARERVSPRSQNAQAEVTRAGYIDASKNATLAGAQAYAGAAERRRAAFGAVNAVPRSNAAEDALRLRVDEQARKAKRASGIASAITGVLEPDPGENPDPRVGDQRQRDLEMGYTG